jgi:hypothetical protein
MATRRVPTSIPASEFAAVINQAKREIRYDVKAGVVPASVRSFSRLHDYVDANEYGGFAIEETASPTFDRLARSDRRSDRTLQARIDFINKVQDALDAWLKAGGLKPAKR